MTNAILATYLLRLTTYDALLQSLPRPRSSPEAYLEPALTHKNARTLRPDAKAATWKPLPDVPADLTRAPTTTQSFMQLYIDYPQSAEDAESAHTPKAAGKPDPNAPYPPRGGTTSGVWLAAAHAQI